MQENASSTTEEPSQKLFDLRETIAFFRDLAIILVVILFVRTYVAAPFQISGSSMEANYHDKEFIIVNKFSYAGIPAVGHVGNPVRGDVVVLRPHAQNGKEFYIKRVIGLPGDQVRFEDGNVYVTPAGSSAETKLDERYLSAENFGKTFLPIGSENNTFVVPAGEYFLMGDNRNNSTDSRSCFLSCSIAGSSHYIPRDQIVGRVFMDLGYFNIFAQDSWRLGSLTWVHPPRFFGTVARWTYSELGASSASGSVVASGSSRTGTATEIR